MSNAGRAAAVTLVADDVALGVPLGAADAGALEAVLMATTLLVRGSSALLTATWNLSLIALEENGRALRAMTGTRPADVPALQAEVGQAAVRRSVVRLLMLWRMVSEVAAESSYPIVHLAWRTLERLPRSTVV
jgi:hypothetical protein